jgi:AMMECR1 domain-containing protein
VSEPLSPADRSALLALARAAIRHRLGIGPPPAIPESGALGLPRGAFVTLHRGGELRGCIGRFDPEGSLARTVADMAAAAAFEDPRFRPLPDPTQLRVGQHGLAVKQGWHRGVLLPVVAVERGWDGPTFLKHACLKAGLRPDAWLDPSTTIEVFDADEFGDPARETP